MLNRFSWGAALLVLGLAACKKDQAYTCDVDPTLLDIEAACVLDEDCPCGTHCGLGICVYECTADRECESGEVCSVFGRCADSDLSPHAPLSTEEGLGSLSLARAQVVIRDPGDIKTFALRANGTDSGRVRVVADDGLEIQCSRTGTFVTECMVESLSAEAELPYLVSVRSTDALSEVDEETHAAVTFWSEHNGRVSGGVTLRGPVEDPGARRQALSTASSYQGTVTLTGIRLSESGQEAFEELSGGDVRLPVTVDAQPDGSGYLLRIDDNLGAVFDGTLMEVSQWGVITSNAQLFVQHEPVAETIAVDVSMELLNDDIDEEEGTVNVAVDEALISIDFVTRFAGLVDGAAPELRWTLVASYVDAFEDTLVRVDPYVVVDASQRSEQVWPAELLGYQDTQQAMCPEGGVIASEVATWNSQAIASGDLACRINNRVEVPATFPLVKYSSGTQTTSGGDAAISFVGNCTRDLSGTGLNDCVDADRVMAGMMVAWEDAGGPTGAAEQRRGHRLVQQWLTIHGWLATEHRGAMRLAMLTNPNATEADLLATLQYSLDGWDVLLHPRLSGALLSIDPDALALPDYRCDAGYSGVCTAATAPTNFHDQHLGLPVSILATLSNQASVLEALFERARYGQVNEEDLIAAAQRYFRVAVLMRAYAEGLAASAGPETSWTVDLVAEQERFEVGLAKLLAQVREWGEGTNPLNISEQDLPLYRVGDEDSELGRFFALSDYLLGTGVCDGADSGDEGIAWEACDQAQSAFVAAQDAIMDTADRAFTEAQYSANASNRNVPVLAESGGALWAMCGWPSGSLANNEADIYDNLDAVDIEACYQPGGPLMQRLSIDEESCYEEGADNTGWFAGYSLCLNIKMKDRGWLTDSSRECRAEWAGLRQLTTEGENIEGWEYDAVLDQYLVTIRGRVAKISSECLQSRLERLACDGCGDATTTYGLVEDFKEVEDRCIEIAQEYDQARAAITSAPEQCEWSQDCPLSMLCQQGTCTPRKQEDERAECFRGSLGATALSVRAAAKQIAAARQSLQDYVTNYEIAIESCAIQADFNAQIENRTADFNYVQGILRKVVAAAEIAAEAADAAKEACSAASGTVTPWGAVAAGGTATAAAFKAGFKTISLSTTAAMNDAVDRHGEVILGLENESAERICYNDASANLVGVQAQLIAIEQAELELSRQLVEFDNLKNEARILLKKFESDYRSQAEAPSSPMIYDLWRDKKVDTAYRQLRVAKRAAWLGLRALEYETQESFPQLRTRILQARRPSDLSSVLSSMRGELDTGTVAGGSPSQLLAVVSFRDDVLDLQANVESGTRGWHSLVPEQRLQGLLADQWYRRDGEIRIQFTLAPISAAQANDGIVIPLRTETDCAERLVSVNASLIGEDLNPGSETTFARVLIEQSNTFSSQWCFPEEHDALDPMQTSSTRPLRNLFSDPLVLGDQYNDSTRIDDGYTTARMSAYFGVDVAGLEQEQYFNGDSLELAGRGIYGDYALVIPPGEFRTTPDGEGLDLAAIDDILLRFDYVSVAQ